MLAIALLVVLPQAGHEDPPVSTLDARAARELRGRGHVVSTSDHGFELRHVIEGVVVRYRVERAGEGWSVTETARRAGSKAAERKPRAR